MSRRVAVRVLTGVAVVGWAVAALLAGVLLAGLLGTAVGR